MALVTLYSNAANTFRGKNTNVPSRVLESYQARGRRYSAVESYVANAASNVATAMVWVPYRAQIIGGKVSWNTNLGASTSVSVGVQGLSASPTDNNVTKLLDATASTGGGNMYQLFSSANTLTGEPYTVQDKAGAWVTVSFTNSCTGKVALSVEWVEA